jgi:6-pyruvoyltetrahydropterin/6-carboxytetrahydropterin synthase
MLITRKVEFSASHVCRSPQLTEEENRRCYGLAANPNGHGHNYILEVTVEGSPDPVTGMVLDLKELKEILNDEVVGPYDHRFLNYEVKPFDQVVPTVENIARDIWERLEPRLGGRNRRLQAVRLYETADLFVDYFGTPNGDVDPPRVTRRYQFAASHRLDTSRLTAEENQRIYGKCNNPYGHGHNYSLEVSSRGPLDERTGIAIEAQRLDKLVGEQVVRPLDHANLNLDVAAFANEVPTSENLAVEIGRRLKANWNQTFPGEWPKLEKIRIAETARNIFEIEADEIQ